MQFITRRAMAPAIAASLKAALVSAAAASQAPAAVPSWPSGQVRIDGQTLELTCGEAAPN